MKQLLSVLTLMILLSSCSEDSTSTTSTNNGKPYLEVLPNSVKVHEYEYFDLKYRVANFSHEDQVRVFVDLGNGDTLRGPYSPNRDIRCFYSEAGNHTLTLSAYDTFSDTLLLTKSIVVVVDPMQPTLSLSPKHLDTTFYYVTNYNFYFVASTNIEAHPALDYTWTVTGNGFNYDTPEWGPGFIAEFPQTGTYKVRVSMIDRNTNNLLGIDSATVTIRQK